MLWSLQVSLGKISVDLGAAYGTAKSGVGISSMGVLKPELIIKSIVPVVMAGILGIYGLIVAVILFQKGRVRTIVSERDHLYLPRWIQAPFFWTLLWTQLSGCRTCYWDRG